MMSGYPFNTKNLDNVSGQLVACRKLFNPTVYLFATTAFAHQAANRFLDIGPHLLSLRRRVVELPLLPLRLRLRWRLRLRLVRHLWVARRGSEERREDSLSRELRQGNTAADPALHQWCTPPCGREGREAACRTCRRHVMDV